MEKPDIVLLLFTCDQNKVLIKHNERSWLNEKTSSREKSTRSKSNIINPKFIRISFPFGINS